MWILGLFREYDTPVKSKNPALHFSMLKQVSIHPLTPLVPLCHLLSFQPSFLQATALILLSISQSSFHPAAVSSSFLISFARSSITFPPLATRPSILSLFFLFHLYLFSINQSSPCGLVLRLHYALPPALIFIS